LPLQPLLWDTVCCDGVSIWGGAPFISTLLSRVNISATAMQQL
jgi:hypothetical protein